MARSRANGSPSPLVARLAELSKETLARAAAEQTIALTPEEPLAFWTALAEPVKLIPAQKKLGRVMRGEG